MPRFHVTSPNELLRRSGNYGVVQRPVKGLLKTISTLKFIAELANISGSRREIGNEWMIHIVGFSGIQVAVLVFD